MGDCKLSMDQKFIIFENIDSQSSCTEESLPPVDLCKINKLIPTDDEKKCCLKINVKTRSTEYIIELNAPSEHCHKSSTDWISAFNKAMEMVFDSQNQTS